MPLLRYCIPTDNVRPSHDFTLFANICPDKKGMFGLELNWSL